MSGALARIFISHSAKEASPAEEVRDAVLRELKARGHEVFVDSDITTGDRWRARLLDELGRCDAAVVILDQEAIDSHWVRREVYWKIAAGPPVDVAGLAAKLLER